MLNVALCNKTVRLNSVYTLFMIVSICRQADEPRIINTTLNGTSDVFFVMVCGKTRTVHVKLYMFLD